MDVTGSDIISSEGESNSPKSLFKGIKQFHKGIKQFHTPIFLETAHNPFESFIEKEKWNPKNTFMQKYSSRINTFKNWPPQIRQSKEKLALSGFYYNGRADYVTCFYCGLGLHNWETSDSVHYEHKKFFPQCKFVDMVS